MITFADRSFCSQSWKCEEKCYRRFTPEMEKKNVELIKLPVAVADFHKQKGCINHALRED